MSEEKKAPSFANKAYVQAEKILRERHKDEFETILSGLYEEAGVERKVRLSKEERAALEAEKREAREAAKRQAAREKATATINALLAEYPDIAEEIVPVADDSAA